MPVIESLPAEGSKKMAKSILHLGSRLDVFEQDRSEISSAVSAVVVDYEQAFRIQFDTLVSFFPSVLKTLHGFDVKSMKGLQIRTSAVADIEQPISVLAATAAIRKPKLSLRKSYLDALLSIYYSLPEPPDPLRTDRDALFVGIQREGRILAETLGWLPEGHSIVPDAKRMFHEGLIVGLSGMPKEDRRWKKVVIIDGAIASGATIVAVMCALRLQENCIVKIYSAHATESGVRAIACVAKRLKLQVAISVGYISGALNKEFYAVQNGPLGSQLVVGDLGDTIAQLAKPKKTTA
jgi:hypothetical protein